jgi:hypothetical protein
MLGATMAQEFRYKKQRFNIVAISIVLLIAGAIYAAYLFIPSRLRESEVLRVLDETSSEFTGIAPRMLEVRDEVRKLQRKMQTNIENVGVDDPNAEYWIEIDNDNQVRFGVLYSDWIDLPFREPHEQIHELEMMCTRPGKGAGWTCETRDLQEDADAIVDAK